MHFYCKILKIDFTLKCEFTSWRMDVYLVRLYGPDSLANLYILPFPTYDKHVADDCETSMQYYN